MSPFVSFFGSLQAVRYQFTDVTLICEGKKIPASKVILAGQCDFFNALFDGRISTQASEYELKGVTYANLEKIVDSFYGMELQLDLDNVVSFIRDADYLLCDKLLSTAVDFLRNNMSVSTILTIKEIAKNYVESLIPAVDHFLINNFGEVCLQDGFVKLSCQDLCRCLSSDLLNVKDEQVVWDAVLRWIQHTTRTAEESADVIGRVRCGLLTKSFFIKEFVTHYIFKHKLQGMVSYLDACSSYFLQLEGEAVLNVPPYIVTPSFAIPRIPSEYLFVLGGYSGNAPSSTIDVYDCRCERWWDLSMYLPHKLAYPAAQAVPNGKVFLFGGVIQDSPTLLQKYSWSTYILDLNRQTITKSLKLKRRRNFVTSVVVGSRIYAIGGKPEPGSHQRLSSCEVLDTAASDLNWKFIKSMKKERSDAGAAHLDGRIFVAGGFDGLNSLNTVEVYNIARDKWTYSQPMSTKRSGVGCAVLDGELYAIGGMDGVARLRSVEKYNPVLREWTRIADLNVPRSNFGVNVVEGRIMVFGGYDGHGVTAAVEFYDKEKDKWCLGEAMCVGKSGMSHVVISRKELAPEMQDKYAYPYKCDLLAQNMTRGNSRQEGSISFEFLSQDDEDSEDTEDESEDEDDLLDEELIDYYDDDDNEDDDEEDFEVEVIVEEIGDQDDE